MSFCDDYPNLCNPHPADPIPPRWWPPIKLPHPSERLQMHLKNLNESQPPLAPEQWLALGLMFEGEGFHEAAMYASLVASTLASGMDYATQVQSLQLQAKALEKLQDPEATKLALSVSERLVSAQVLHQQLNERLNTR